MLLKEEDMIEHQNRQRQNKKKSKEADKVKYVNGEEIARDGV